MVQTEKDNAKLNEAKREFMKGTTLKENEVVVLPRDWDGSPGYEPYANRDLTESVVCIEGWRKKSSGQAK